MNTLTLRPELAIIRYSDELFLSVPLQPIDLKDCEIFELIDEDDSYHEMRYDHVVLARRADSGSVDLARFEIAIDNEPTKVIDCDHETLEEILIDLIESYLEDGVVSTRIH